MAYFELTTSAQIQAILTVSEEDLPIEVIEAQGLEDDLGAALDVVPGWSSIDKDSKNGRALRLFAKYFCAGTLAGMAQIFVLKKTSDGSNEGQRSDKDGWAFVATTLLAKATAHLQVVIDDLDPSTATGLPYTIFSRVEPDRDPIITPRATVAS